VVCGEVLVRYLYRCPWCDYEESMIHGMDEEPTIRCPVSWDIDDDGSRDYHYMEKVITGGNGFLTHGNGFERKGRV
jgi:hypothetical protein